MNEEQPKDKTRPGDQPLPVMSAESQDVQEALLEMIRERRAVGVQRYGSPLMTHNGRDALQDALEEAVDLSAYLMQVKMERRDERPEKFSYQHLLAHVSDNFRMTYGRGEEQGTSALHCKLHGEVKTWDHRVTSELEMMSQIGLHMDLHDHDEWKKTR